MPPAGGRDGAEGLFYRVAESCAIRRAEKGNGRGRKAFFFYVRHNDAHPVVQGMQDDASAHFPIPDDDKCFPMPVIKSQGGQGAEETFPGAQAGFNLFDFPRIHHPDGLRTSHIMLRTGPRQFHITAEAGDMGKGARTIQDDIVRTFGPFRAYHGNSIGRQQEKDFRIMGHDPGDGHRQIRSGRQQGGVFGAGVPEYRGGVNHPTSFQRAAFRPSFILIEQHGEFFSR